MHLKPLGKLRRLDLQGCKITDAGVESLKALTSLTALGVKDTQLGDAALKQLQAALPRCKIAR